MLKAGLMGVSTNSQLIKDLDHKSRALTSISNSFVECGKNLRIFSFFETQKLDFMNCLVIINSPFNKNQFLMLLLRLWRKNPRLLDGPEKYVTELMVPTDQCAGLRIRTSPDTSQSGNPLKRWSAGPSFPL